MRLKTDAFETRRFIGAVELDLQNAFRNFFNGFAARFYDGSGFGKKHRISERAREKFDAAGGLTRILLKAQRKIAEIPRDFSFRSGFGFNRLDNGLKLCRAGEN